MLHWVIGALFAVTLLSPASAEEKKLDTLSIRPIIGISKDTSPVSVEIGGHKMIIPRNYLGAAWFSDGYLALQFFVTYPTFGGVTEENFKSMNRFVGASAPDVIVITRYEGYEHQSTFRQSLSKAAREFGLKTDLDGLVSVEKGFNNWQGFINNGLSYYVAEGDSETNDIIIECTPLSMNLHNCTIDSKFYDGVGFRYEFFFSHLKDWRKIYNGATKMLTNFFGK